MPQEELSLSTICGGSLDEAFKGIYPELLSRCMSGEKATIGINIELERVADTTTIVRTAYKIKTGVPAIAGKAALCTMDSDFRLKTEIETQPKVIGLFKVEGGKGNE